MRFPFQYFYYLTRHIINYCRPIMIPVRSANCVGILFHTCFLLEGVFAKSVWTGFPAPEFNLALHFAIFFVANLLLVFALLAL